MKKNLKYIFILSLLCIFVTIMYNKVYIPKTTYHTVLPESGSLDVKVFGIGYLGAQNIYSLNAQTGGKIISILADEGDWVKKGDLLVTIDPVDIPKLLEEARVTVQKSHFELEASKREISSLEATHKLALITHKRSTDLVKTKTMAKAEFDKSLSALEVIVARIASAESKFSAAEAEIVRAEKRVEGLEIKISRYKVYSPIDGFIISKDSEESHTVPSSQSILSIVNTKTIWIKTYIDEKISGDIRLGQKASIVLRSQRNKTYEGIVKRIVAKSDSVTGEREVNIAFKKLPIPFYINEQAEISIFTKKFNDVVKVPSNLVIFKDGEPGLWIDQDNKAHFQSISIIARGDSMIAVSGLDPKSPILTVLPSNKSLKEGMKVH